MVLRREPDPHPQGSNTLSSLPPASASLCGEPGCIPIPPCKANLHLPPCEHQSFGPFLGLKMVSLAVQPFLERTDSRQCPTPAWKEGLGLFGK